MTTETPRWRLGDAVYLEGKIPARILQLDPERRLALVGYEGSPCRCGEPSGEITVNLTWEWQSRACDNGPTGTVPGAMRHSARAGELAQHYATIVIHTYDAEPAVAGWQVKGSVVMINSDHHWTRECPPGLDLPALRALYQERARIALDTVHALEAALEKAATP